VLGGMDAVMEGFGCVVIQNGDGLLADDGAGIHAGIHEMDGAAGDLDAMVEGLLPSFEAGEGGEEGWVDVDDAAGEGAQKVAFEDAHEAAKHDEVHLGVLQGGDEGLFGRFVQLGAEFAGGDELGGDLALAGVGEDAGWFDIAQDDGDQGGDAAGGDGVGDGEEIGALAGTEETDAKGAIHGDSIAEGAGKTKWKANLNRKMDGRAPRPGLLQEESRIED